MGTEPSQRHQGGHYALPGHLQLRLWLAMEELWETANAERQGHHLTLILGEQVFLQILPLKHDLTSFFQILIVI